MTVIFSVLGAFLASVIGAWVAAKVAGVGRAEPGILHGVAAWLVVMGIILVLAAVDGANSLQGDYVGGLTPPGAPTPTGTPPDPNAAIAIRNSALGSILGILIGLMGAAIGGWMASGEPMNFTHHRTRDRDTSYSTTRITGERTTRI